ncbi:MAG: MurR/RpiR family transcriptional regulator [Rhodospirillales bacterium]|jgi:DNA-binding MurR/RpiR family transcriptional regulator|nr:MurR/RpiR family transcriptional regulator [Rhodospirillales bacterium]MDP6774087.1 MurR/RpiR family transcriptional regulator [Rhodospirillales bacterium]
MDFATLSKRIAETFPRLSPQLQRAARHVLDRPDDVALMSMRGLAARAGVHPSTMVRLARAFDFTSYNQLREPFQQHLRISPAGYLARARDLQARGAEGEPAALLWDLLSADLANLRVSFEANGVGKFAAAAETLSGAERIYVAGLRSSYPVAFFFHYVYRMFRSNAVLLEGHAGTFADGLRALASGDVMLAISVEPYTVETVKAVEYAKGQGAAVVVLTDSLVSPLAESADHVLIVNNETPSFFHSVAPAIAVAEALIVLMVAEGGPATLESIEKSEGQLANFYAYWRSQTVKKRHRARHRPKDGAR